MDELGGPNGETAMIFSLPNLHFSTTLDASDGLTGLDAINDNSSKKLNTKKNLDSVRFETAQNTAAKTSHLISRSQSLRNRQLKSAYQGVISQHQNPPNTLNHHYPGVGNLDCNYLHYLFITRSKA